MSPYAPIRLREEDWWQFARQVGVEGFVTPNGMISGNLTDLIMSSLIAPKMRAIGNLSTGSPEDQYALGQTFVKLLVQRHWVPFVAQYELNGRQIFDLNDEVVSLLGKTDITDCTLQEWNPPYDCFFVRFGKQELIKLPFDSGFEYLDGAFIAVTPWGEPGGPKRRLKIGLTTVKDDGSGVMMPGYFIDFTPDEQLMNVPEAIESFLKRKFSDLDDDEGDGPNHAAIVALRKEELTESAELLRQSTALVVNALYYIESIGSTKDLSPGRDVPPELHVKWEQTPLIRRHKLTRRFTSEGYALVRMMGDEFQHSGAAVDDSRADVSTHWRRGHWRRQPHGPQLMMRKRVWIRPVLVNPARPHDDLPGHIYSVGGRDISVH